MRGIVSIDVQALASNYAILKQRVAGGCVIAPTMKADAYGLGIAQCAQPLWRAGARSFFVALPEEGMALRGLLKDAQIFILHGFLADDASLYTQHGLVPVLNSLAQIRAYQDYARSRETAMPCILHFDTGMNRLGIPPQDEVDDLSGLDVIYVMSNFASSDEYGNPLTAEQARRLKKIAAKFPDAKRSLCNSSGIFRDAEYHLDMVRPGYALYGGNPVPETQNPMASVVSLHVPVMQVHAVRKGETAGYGQTYKFAADGHVAVVSMGYADGFLRSASNRAALYWKGHQCPVRGRVSMDLVICDLGNVPEREFPLPGDMIEILGPHQSVDQLASGCGTIGYEILTQLGKRYEIVVAE